MSRSHKDKMLREYHKEGRRCVKEQDWSDYEPNVHLTNRKKLPIRTGENGHRYGNLRKYYAEMKVLGRRRQRAQEREEFRNQIKNSD